LASEEEIESIQCVKTRNFRIDEYGSTGNGKYPHTEERENRILGHQKRVQNEYDC